jgi:uncharacterized protein DUF5076
MIRNPNLPRYEALIIPNEALEEGGVEVLRAGIIEGELHVTLRPTFEEPGKWGDLLSELVRRIAKAYAAAGPVREDEVVVRIRAAFVGVDEAPAAKSGKSAQKKTAKRPPGKRRTKKRARR